MTNAEWITAIVLFVFAAGLALISIRQFSEKGFLFHNAYLYASREERSKMDKKPYYRQSAIVFALLSALFLVTGLSVVTQNSRLQMLEIPLVAGALIYAVASTIRIETGKKQSKPKDDK